MLTRLGGSFLDGSIQIIGGVLHGRSVTCHIAVGICICIFCTAVCACAYEKDQSVFERVVVFQKLCISRILILCNVFFIFRQKNIYRIRPTTGSNSKTVTQAKDLTGLRFSESITAMMTSVEPRATAAKLFASQPESKNA